MNSTTPLPQLIHPVSPFPFTHFLHVFHSGGSVQEVPNNKEVFVCIILLLTHSGGGLTAGLTGGFPWTQVEQGEHHWDQLEQSTGTLACLSGAGCDGDRQALGRTEIHDRGLFCVSCLSPVTQLAYVWQIALDLMSQPTLSLASALQMHVMGALRGVCLWQNKNKRFRMFYRLLWKCYSSFLWIDASKVKRNNMFSLQNEMMNVQGQTLLTVNSDHLS